MDQFYVEDFERTKILKTIHDLALFNRKLCGYTRSRVRFPVGNLQLISSNLIMDR